MGKKILIVDDSASVRQQLSFVLNKGGFQVVEAGDGKEGLEMLAANADTALIFCDVNMPNLNGLDMLERVKANEQFAGVPVIMLTTEASNTLIERARGLGAKGWMVKPFHPDQVIAIANKLTAQAA